LFPVAVPFSGFLDPTGRSGEPPPLQSNLKLLLLARNTATSCSNSAKDRAVSRLAVFVREIRVTGSTVFSAEELAKVTAPYLNREVTSEDLEALRVALTLL